MNLRQAAACALLSVALFSEMAIWTGVALGANDTVFACVKKSNGVTRIISPSGHCKNSESPIQWNITGPQGPTGPTGPQGPGALILVDAVGQPIGTYYLDFSVAIKVGDIAVYIAADTSFEERTIDFIHNSADCSGPRYLFDQEPSVISVGRTTDGKTAYYAQLGVAPIQLGTGSSMEEIAQGGDPSQPGTCSPLISELDPYVPALSLDLSTFTPPFHLQ
jgi:hypothetical protein